MNIALIGPPGAGKSTQAHKIADKYGLHHVESGEFIRKLAVEDSKKGEIVNRLANEQGKLVPDGLVIGLILEELLRFEFHNILLDGFPRTLNQYYSILGMFMSQDSRLDGCFYLKVSRLEAEKRAKLRGRVDDDAVVIGKRADEYDKSIQPVLNQLKEDSMLTEIDGESVEEEVTRKLYECLDKISWRSRVGVSGE